MRGLSLWGVVRPSAALARALGLSLACCGLLLGAGCAGLSHRVDRALLSQVPNEELLLLFDAENAVYIARDEADLATRSLEDARTAQRRAEKYRDLIGERRKSGAAIDTAQVIELLEQWNNARIEMRNREVALRELELRTSDVRLWAARARYEKAKAKLVKDFNPAEANDINPADFEAQAKEWEAREAEAIAGLKEQEGQLSEARTTYIDLARRLQQESKGAYGGPWADLLD